MGNTLNRFKIFLNSRKIFKNWYLYLLIYLNITNSKHKIFETNFGMKMKIRVKSTDLMQLTTIWVVNEYDYPDFEIKEDDTIIDIGGHIGLFALYCNQFTKTGKIFSFEPIKENYDMFLENMKINGFENIMPHNLAVTKTEGNIPIYLNNDESGHSVFEKNTKVVNVESITLKKIFDINNIKRCNLLKLDCEGSEYEIIESLSEEYFKKIDKIIIEYHFAGKYPDLFRNLIKKLESVSFTAKIERTDENMGLIFAQKIN